jgi:hypothetical protein
MTTDLKLLEELKKYKITQYLLRVKESSIVNASLAYVDQRRTQK